MSHEALVAIFAVAMIPGLVGTLLPILPGIPLMFLVAVVFGFVDRFEHLVAWEFGLLLAIVVLSLVVDYVSGLIGARFGGAGRRATLWGFAGLVIGLIVLPPFGGLIGLFLGVLISELVGHGEGVRALRAATGSLIGSLVGVVLSSLLAVIFLTAFVLFALR